MSKISESDAKYAFLAVMEYDYQVNMNDMEACLAQVPSEEKRQSIDAMQLFHHPRPQDLSDDDYTKVVNKCYKAAAELTHDGIEECNQAPAITGRARSAMADIRKVNEDKLTFMDGAVYDRIAKLASKARCAAHKWADPDLAKQAQIAINAVLEQQGVALPDDMPIDGLPPPEVMSPDLPPECDPPPHHTAEDPPFPCDPVARRIPPPRGEICHDAGNP